MGPKTHPACCAVGTGSFPGVKAAGSWRWPPTPSSAEVAMGVGTILPPPLFACIDISWGCPLVLCKSGCDCIRCKLYDEPISSSLSHCCHYYTSAWDSVYSFLPAFIIMRFLTWRSRVTLFILSERQNRISSLCFNWKTVGRLTSPLKCWHSF
jgi:hypothetical protein